MLKAILILLYFPSVNLALTIHQLITANIGSSKCSAYYVDYPKNHSGNCHIHVQLALFWNTFTKGPDFELVGSKSYWTSDELKLVLSSKFVELRGWTDFVPVGVGSNVFTYQFPNQSMAKYAQDIGDCAVTTTKGNDYHIGNLELAAIVGFQANKRLHVHFGTVKFIKGAGRDQLKLPVPILLIQKNKIMQGCPIEKYHMRWKKLAPDIKYSPCPKTLKGNKLRVMQR